MPKSKITEEELAEVVVTYLKKNEWDVYQEVQVRRGGRTADIVATKGKELWVIEVKNTLSFAVVGQAYYWKPWATYISVAVPRPKKKKSAGRKFAHKVMHDYSIGMLEVEALQNRVVNFSINKPNKKAKTRKIASVLTERHKTFAKAGNSKGLKLTPYKLTCERILQYVEEHQGCYLKDVLANIEHHYSPRSAWYSARKRLRLDHIPHIVSRWDSKVKDRKLWTSKQKKSTVGKKKR